LLPIFLLALYIKFDILGTISVEFQINFYKNSSGKSPVEEFFLELAKGNRVLVAGAHAGIKKLRLRVYHREPLSKHIESGLWELRIKAGNDILRIFYTFAKDQIIILLHGFVKKQQKTPGSELEVARRRLRELKEREKL
jgi:phage-related protein